MSHDESKTRIEFNPEELEKLLILVRDSIKGKSLPEVTNSPDPGLFMKLNRGYKRLKPPLVAAGPQHFHS